MRTIAIIKSRYYFYFNKKTVTHMTTNGLGVRIIVNIKPVFLEERKKRMFGFKRLEFDAFKNKKDSESDEYI